FTPKVTTVAWMGFDRPRSLGATETSGGLALPIWVNYMRAALDGQEVSELVPLPDDLSRTDGDFYFSEFPPGEAVARIGLTHPLDERLNDDEEEDDDRTEDGIFNLLKSLRSNPDEGQQQPSSNDAAETVPF